MQSNSKSALKAGMGYTIGNILVKGINFLSIPVFSRLLSTEEFGVYNVFVSYDSILFVLIGMALHTSVRSANQKFSGKIDEYTSSITLIPCINLCILLLIAFLFGNHIATWMGFSRLSVYMLVIYSFGSAVVTLYNNRISLDYSYKKYLIVSLLNSVGNIGLSLALIFSRFREAKDVGRIMGSTITIFVLGIAILVSLYKKSKPSYNKTYWGFALKYSAPIIPHGISQVVLAQVDRIMIQRLVSSSAAGIYSLAGNIKLILTIITDSISNAWSTWFYEEMNDDKTAEIQKRAKQLSLLFAIFSIGLIALSPELIWILGGEEYSAGKYVAVPMIIDAFVLFLYNVIVPSEYYTQKTQYIMMATVAAAVINLVTNYIFISMFGFIAAAYTTLFSYICYLLFHIFVSRHLTGFFVMPVKNILIDIVLVASMGGFTLFFSNNIFVRYFCCALMVIPIGLVLLNSIYKERKNTAE